MTLDDVQFYMVSDNTTHVSQRLDELRVQMPKFICLNDDMNKTDVEAGRVSGSSVLLREFYESYFPVRCAFELDEGVRNEFMYVEEWGGRMGRGRGWVGGLVGGGGRWSGLGWLVWMVGAVVVGGLVGLMVWWWVRQRSGIGGVLDRRRMRINGYAFQRTSTIV